MKKILCASLMFLTFLSLLSADLFGQGQEEKPRVSVEVNYFGGDLKTEFDYPKANPPNSSGKLHEINGLQFLGRVAINGRITIGGRMEENFLRQSRFFSKDQFGSRTDPDTNNVGSDSRYQEIFASMALPKTAGHRLLAGVARTVFNQEREFKIYPSSPPPSVQGGGDMPISNFPPFKINSRLGISAIGPMVGIEGGRGVKELELNWSGRVYPRMARTDRDSTVSELRENDRDRGRSSKWSSSSHGFELRGTATYWLASRVALTGGYQYRRLDKPDQFPQSNWVVNETQTEKGFLGGLKFTF